MTGIFFIGTIIKFLEDLKKHNKSIDEAIKNLENSKRIMEKNNNNI